MSRAGRLKRAWQEAGLTWPKALAAALTAITVALISPRITSFANSIIAVGIISLVSTAFAAAYNALLALTQSAMSRVAKVEVEESGEEVEVVETYEDAPDQQSKSRWRTYLVYPLLFAVISVATIGASWAIAGGHEPSQVVVSVDQSQSLSEQEKQELIDSAADKAKSGLVEPAASTEVVAPAEEDTSTEGRISALQAKNDALSQQLARVDAELAELKAGGSTTGTTEPAANAEMTLLREQVAALQEQVDTLSEQLAALQEPNPDRP